MGGKGVSPSLDGCYSVKSAYSYLSKDSSTTGAPKGIILQVVSRVWKALAPSKAVSFS